MAEQTHGSSPVLLSESVGFTGLFIVIGEGLLTGAWVAEKQLQTKENLIPAPGPLLKAVLGLPE